MLLKRFESDETMRQRMAQYLKGIEEEKPRYYNASVRILESLFSQLPDRIAKQLLDTLTANKTANAFDAYEIASSLLVRNNLAPLKKTVSRYGRRGKRPCDAVSANLDPQRTDIASYDMLINELTQN